jgi:mannitol-1-phosphate/altronate dehydrogenase
MSMKNIAEKISKPVYPVRILQFGEGNFLRAFVDWMVDRMNEEVDFRTGVTVIQPIADGLAQKINAQNGLYTFSQMRPECVVCQRRGPLPDEKGEDSKRGAYFLSAGGLSPGR